MFPDPHEDDPPELTGKQVRFRIRDVYVPEPAQILEDLHGQDLLCGRIIDISDRGERQRSYAVVQVEGLVRPVVVPMAKVIAAEE